MMAGWEEVLGRNVYIMRCAQDNLRGQKSLGPLKMSHKKNYVPQFLKQRDINSYFVGVLRSMTK
jgi:hypothetical protein